MSEEQNQALIEDCQDEISKLERAIRSVNSYAKPAYRDEFISEYQSQLKRQQIALAALTAQPVKLMDCDFGAVSHMSGGSKDYCNGFVDGTQNAIKAIRAAGYQVEGE